MKYALLLLAACGDNIYPDGEPLPTAPALAIVAHQDDDLLFMQPEEFDAFASGNGAVNVYVTAGNALKGVDYAELRYRALRAAYGGIVGSERWNCGWISVRDHRVEHCRIDDKKISLVFLGYPDGGKMGEYEHSLLKLWEGEIDSAETVAHEPSTYTQQELIDVVADIIDQVQPSTVRTLEVSAAHGRDHADHMMVGALSVLAMGAAHSKARLLSYRGYGTESEPENVLPAYYDRSLGPLARYEGCVDGSVTCGVAASTVDDAHSIWMHRRYAVGFRPFAFGKLQLGDQCMDTSGSNVVLRDCATAGVWSLEADGTLANQGIVQALPTGELAFGDLTAASSFRLDDEGHLWAPLPPVAADGLDVDHDTCLDADGGRVRALRCGATHAATWRVTPVTTRASLDLPNRVGGPVIADANGDGIPDLCAFGVNRIECLPGLGDPGNFGPAVTLGGVLPIDHTSLVIGSLGGDGHAVACGFAVGGLTCESLAGSTDGALLWGGHPFAGEPVDSTLSIGKVGNVPALCAQTSIGFECATSTGATTLSTWPTNQTTALGADLDGDGQTDWCALDSRGASCAVIADRALTTDGMPWSFALGGSVPPIDAGPGTVAFGDLDGDGRADLCRIAGNDIVCMRSSDHGFGPAFVAWTPPTPPRSLAMGDLDGDGIADLCADDGSFEPTAIVCTISHPVSLLAR